MGRRIVEERKCEQCSVIFPWDGRNKGRFCSRGCTASFNAPRTISSRAEKLRARPRPSAFSRMISRCATAASGCVEWQGPRHNGYGKVTVDGVPRLAHRIAWAEAYGVIPAGLCVLHRCDNPPCVNPDHLFLGTRQDNSADMVSKGRARALQGEAAVHAKLTEDDVRRIRVAWSEAVTTGETQGDIGARFGTSRNNVSGIVRRNKWRCVP